MVSPVASSNASSMASSLTSLNENASVNSSRLSTHEVVSAVKDTDVAHVNLDVTVMTAETNDLSDLLEAGYSQDQLSQLSAEELAALRAQLALNAVAMKV